MNVGASARRRVWMFCALVLLVLGLGVWAQSSGVSTDDKNLTSFTGPPDRGGPTTRRGGVIIGAATVIYSRTDIVLHESWGDFAISRSFGTTPGSRPFDQHYCGLSFCASAAPAAPLGAFGGEVYGWDIHAPWDLNFDSYIEMSTAGDASTGLYNLYRVRLPGGQVETFGDCPWDVGGQCLASPYGANGTLTARNPTTPNDGYPPGPGFVYRSVAGERYIFLSNYNALGVADGRTPDLTPTSTRKYLTAVESSQYPVSPTGPRQVKYVITYAQPPGCTTSGARLLPDSAPGVPYISSVQTGDGAILRFTYTSSGQCRLSSIARDTPTGPKMLVSYGYGSDVTALTVSYPETGEQLTYTPGSLGPDWIWTIGRDGGPDQGRYALDAGQYGLPERVAGAARSYLDEDQAFSYTSTLTGSCDGGTWPLCSTSYTDETSAPSGRVAGGGTGLRESYLNESNITWEGNLTREYNLACNGGDCASVSPVRQTWYLETLSNHMSVTKSQFTANGSWNLYTNTVNANGWREFLSAAHGASSQTDPNPLDRTTFTYEYHNPTTKVPEQFVSSSSKASVIQAGGTVTQVRVYDAATNYMRAEFISGYTKPLGGSSPSPQVLGKFYLTWGSLGCSGGPPDPLGRTIEVHGPCLVSSTSATYCDMGGPIPVTYVSYYPSNDTSDQGFNANKLKTKTVIVQLPGAAECSGTRLTTTYSSYDSRGRPTVITDPNNTSTTRAYQGEWLMSEVRAGPGLSATETNTYDPGTGKISTTTHATGNTERFCYRTGASSSCTGGQPSNNLQWKARLDGSGNPIERVDYQYQHGKVIKETYSNSSGTRRVLNHIYDAQGRLASDGPGATDYVFSRASYDAMDSPTGLGAPYNSPSELCGANGNGVPTDGSCSVLTYDKLERLVGAATPTTGVTPSSTCIAYDALGHVSKIAMGVTGMTCAAALGGGAPLAQYAYDDFGRLLSVAAPWMGSATQSSGTTFYEYDALGNITKKQTPSMREALPSGEYLSYDYDSLGRVTAAWHQHPGGSPAQELLYGFAYDSATSLAGVTVPANCTSNTLGRVRIRADSFGTTFYSYNAFGQVTDEFRVRAGAPASCSVNAVGAPNDQTPSTHRVYSSVGLLTDLVYPHGRHLKYVYGAAANGTQDRLMSIQYGDWSSGAETFKTLLQNIQYEAYGSISKYDYVAPSISTGNILTVEYLFGSPSALPGSQACNGGRPGSIDGTGRLAALWVSKAGTADILRKTYTWKADQLVAEDSCVLQSSAATGTRTYYGVYSTGGGYDSTLQVKYVSRPVGEFTQKGGAVGLRNYTYDTRGNRTLESADCWSWGNTYSGTHGDQLVTRSVTSGCALMPNPKLTVKYAYDGDGRASRKSWPSPSNPSVDAAYLSFDASIDAAHAAVGAVYKAVSVNGMTYEYYYDADGRRRAKLYPTGEKDEYFYDADSSLLEDRGVDGSGGYTLDEYIWLGGRPVALLRSKLSSAWARGADRTGNCTRNGLTGIACDVYAIVTDYLPKPVALIDSSARLAGVGEYDPFGHVNRVTSPGDSAHHPYQSGDHRILGYFNQPAGTGLTVDARPRFAIFSAATTTTAYLADINEGPIGPSHTAGEPAAQAAAWTAVPANGVFRLAFKPGDSNSGNLDGIVSDGYEYRRYQTGATAAWTPLRFPGQYFDAETDLFQNWNRFYDASIGRYLEPDPLWLYPEKVVPMARQGRLAPIYGYAGNNPVIFVDVDGMLPSGADALVKLWEALNALGGGAWQKATAYAQAGTAFVVSSQGVRAAPRAIGYSAGAVTGITVGVFLLTSSPTAADDTWTSARGQALLQASSEEDDGVGTDATPAEKKAVRAENREAHGGNLTCENCGRDDLVDPQRARGGVPRPENEAQVDHIKRKADGGKGKRPNLRVLCPACNKDGVIPR